MRKRKKKDRKKKKKKERGLANDYCRAFKYFLYTRALNSLEKKLDDDALSDALQISITFFCKGTDK